MQTFTYGTLVEQPCMVHCAKKKTFKDLSSIFSPLFIVFHK